jgi:hypothetical protein
VDIASSLDNSKSFYWTVPDLTTTLTDQPNAKIRITDDTKGTVGESDAFTIAIPTMTVVRPAGGEIWAVGDSAPIKWSYDGAVIGPLTLQYDASGTVSDTSPTIATNVGKTGGADNANDGTYTYNWSLPAGAQTANVRVRVKDSQRPNSYADSAAVFEVIGAPTINVSSPADGDVFVWTVQGLSVGDVNIEYWDDANLNDTLDAGETLLTLATGVSRGSSDTGDEYSGTYTGTTTITLPDTALVSANLKLQVRDPVGGYVGLAAGHFRIRGGFEFRDETDSNQVLSSTTEWVANTSHTIKWYNKGSFDEVKLEYAISSDGTTWDSYTTIESSLTNSPDASNITSYSWTVPDPNLANYPSEPPEYYYLKLKITNLADTSVYEESASFKITYYTVTWTVKDYDTMTRLDSLTVSSVYGGKKYWDVAGDSLTATSDPRYTEKTYPRRYPYGTFTTFWSKEGYIDRSDDNRQVTADTQVTVLLESTLSAQMQYKVYAGFAYDEEADTLKMNSWLEKKGTLITGVDEDVGKYGAAYIKIYDGQTLLTTLTAGTPISESGGTRYAPDDSGNYWFEVSDVTAAVADGGLGLVSGRTYFAKMGIYYREREYQSGASFEITSTQKLKEYISTEAAATRTKIEEKAQEIKTEVTTKAEEVKTKVAEVKAETAKILTATGEESLPTKIEAVKQEVVTEVQPHVKSGILNRETMVKQGDTITIRYRSDSGLSPTIDVYNPDNIIKVSKGTMKEIGTTGVYEYDVKFQNAWGTGDFSVICSESTKGTVDALIITVVKHDIAEVAGQVSAIMGTTTRLTGLAGVADTLNSQISLIEGALSKISKDMSTKVQEVSASLADMESVYNQLVNVSAQIKKIGATEGINLEKVYEVSKEKKDDIVYLKNKTQELKATVELSQKMIENVANKPVVQTWFEFR